MQVTIDLETLGVGTKPVLLSIGAVKHTDTEILDEFHVGIDIDTAIAAGLKVTGGTVSWWLDDERDAARKSLHALEKVDLGSALVGFAQWYGGEPLPTWGNGASSDNVWLRSAYEAIGWDCPFPFFMDRCYRTMKNLFPQVMPPVPRGTHHDALDDARYQARHLQAILAHIEAPRSAAQEFSIPQLMIDEGSRLIESHARQFRVYEENHQRQANDLTLQQSTRAEKAGKANVNRLLAEEAEAFLAKIQAA